MAVQFAYDNGTCRRDLELTAALPGATVADLAAALGAHGPDLVIDGRLAEGAAPLDGSGLLAGSTVATGRGGREARPASPAVIARVIGGCAAGQSFPLVPGPAIIGRDEEAAVRLRGQAVSRRHCRLDIAASGTVVLTDLGSRNGTDLNGSRLTGPAAAGPGDVISVGGEVLLRLVSPASTGPPAPQDPLRGPIKRLTNP
ncbi:MAG: FHA domain-containing protein, partial [Nocardiopsaceae bacterium]|nr:FHA domain-containing protein [Nocardiopsaceae bacterium]